MEKKIVSHGLVIGFFLSLILFFNSLPACTENPADPTPTPTSTSTPTITPTATPTGNAPYPIFPINNAQVSGETITFDWTDPPGARNYVFTMLVWYPPGQGGNWIPLWNGIYQSSSTSQLTLSRDEIWFYFQEESFGWLSADYAWAVTSDTSTSWSQYGYFTWL
jgi:hypothetical protein